MEHIPARHAARLGMRYPATVVGKAEDAISLYLDLTLLAPGRFPKLRAIIFYDRTLSPAVAAALSVGDGVQVVLIELSPDPHSVHLASFPADPAWLTWNNETVRRLARHIRATGEMDQLPILADALEDAGCVDAALLAHCREPHDPGTRSWAVDLLATQT